MKKAMLETNVIEDIVAMVSGIHIVGYSYKKYYIHFNTHLCELRKSITP